MNVEVARSNEGLRGGRTAPRKRKDGPISLDHKRNSSN